MSATAGVGWWVGAACTLTVDLPPIVASLAWQRGAPRPTRWWWVGVPIGTILGVGAELAGLLPWWDRPGGRCLAAIGSAVLALFWHRWGKNVRCGGPR